MRQNKIIPNKKPIKAHPFTNKELLLITLVLYVGCLIADNLEQFLNYLNK